MTIRVPVAPTRFNPPRAAGMPWRFAGVVLALVGPALAQTVVVVDANNGPGTHFVSLAAATAAAPDGAVLLVRQGHYTADATIQAKSLTVLAEPGAVVGSVTSPDVTFAVLAIAGSQRVVVRGLQLEAGFFGTTTLRCDASPGQILIEDVTVSAANLGATRLDASACGQLLVRDSGFAGQTRLLACTAAFVDCVLPSLPGNRPAGLVQMGGDVSFDDCVLSGNSATGTPGTHAVTMNGGRLRVLGNSSLTGAGGFSAGKAITGTGLARLDPSVVVTTFGTPPFGSGIQVTVASMPRAQATSVPLGGTVQATLFGPAGHLGFLLASLPGPPTPVAFLADPLWLDPAAAVVQAVGLSHPAVAIASAIQIPANPALWGFVLHWQGLTFDVVVGWQASNPAFYAGHG